MYKACTDEILDELRATLEAVDQHQVEELLQMISSANCVFFIGVGRVLLSLEAIAKRWNHLGIHTTVVGSITEPAITDQDVLIVGSGSGESAFPLVIAKKAKQFNAKVVHIGTNPKCSMSQYSDLFVQIPASNKTDNSGVTSVQPMTSLFEQSLLLFGDAVALIYIREHNLDLHSLWQYHANLE